MNGMTDEMRERLAAAMMRELEIDDLLHRPVAPPGVTLSKSDLYKSWYAPFSFRLTREQLALLNQEPQRGWLDELLAAEGVAYGDQLAAGSDGKEIHRRPLRKGGLVKVRLQGDYAHWQITLDRTQRPIIQTMFIKTRQGGRFRILLRKGQNLYTGQSLADGPELPAFQDPFSELVLA